MYSVGSLAWDDIDSESEFSLPDHPEIALIDLTILDEEDNCDDSVESTLKNFDEAPFECTDCVDSEIFGIAANIIGCSCTGTGTETEGLYMNFIDDFKEVIDSPVEDYNRSTIHLGRIPGKTETKGPIPYFAPVPKYQYSADIHTRTQADFNPRTPLGLYYETDKNTYKKGNTSSIYKCPFTLPPTLDHDDGASRTIILGTS